MDFPQILHVKSLEKPWKGVLTHTPARKRCIEASLMSASAFYMNNRSQNVKIQNLYRC